MDEFFIQQLDSILARKEENLERRIKANGNALADFEQKGEGRCGGVKVPVALEENMSAESVSHCELSKIRTVRAKIKEGKLEICSDCGCPIEEDRLKVMLNGGDSIITDCMTCHKSRNYPKLARVPHA